jgi:hypothetical protein
LQELFEFSMHAEIEIGVFIYTKKSLYWFK